MSSYLVVEIDSKRQNELIQAMQIFKGIKKITNVDEVFKAGGECPICATFGMIEPDEESVEK